MNYLLGLILMASAFISFGQEKDFLRVQELNVQSDYYLNVNRDTVCHLAKQASRLNDGRFPKEEVKTFLLLGMCQKFQGNLDTAYNLFTQAMVLSNKLEMSKELGTSYWYRGKVFLEMNEFEKAKPEYQRAIEIFEDAEEYERQFKALNGLAYLEQKQGNLAISLEYHLGVLEIVEREKFDGFKLRTYANVAEIYLQLGDKKNALEFNSKSLQVLDTAIYKGHLISSLIQRASLYDATDNADSSAYYLDQALRYSERFDLEKSFVHLSIGHFLEKKGETEEAIRNFRKGYAVSRTALIKSEFLLALSKSYLELQKYDSALYYAQEGYHHAFESRNKRAILESTKILAGIFEGNGDVANANKFLNEHSAYKDSLLIGNDRRKLTDLQVQLETIDKNREIDSLRSQAELEAFRRLILVRGGTLLVFIFFIAIALMVRRSKKRQRVQEYKAASLQNEIEKGRHDLNNQSLHLIRVNNSVLEIEEKLKELKPKVQGHSMEVQRLINTIRVNKSQDKDWENFNNYFNGLNSGFADRMREQFPSLTINEIRLCSLLKMNLLNGEIASILNVETRSVTMSKYRLKKKLNLSEEVDLSKFLMDLEFSEEEKRYA